MNNGTSTIVVHWSSLADPVVGLWRPLIIDFQCSCPEIFSNSVCIFHFSRFNRVGSISFTNYSHSRYDQSYSFNNNIKFSAHCFTVSPSIIGILVDEWGMWRIAWFFKMAVYVVWGCLKRSDWCMMSKYYCLQQSRISSAYSEKNKYSGMNDISLQIRKVIMSLKG